MRDAGDRASDRNASVASAAATNEHAVIAAILLATVLQHWLVVNDIHLNPYSKAGVVRGSDTTSELWRETLPAMRADVPNPSVVLLGGDMLAHHFPTVAAEAHVPVETAVLATNARIARDLGALYPRAQFLVAQGNNDDPCGDYKSETDGAFQRALARIWEPLVNRNRAAPDFPAQFARGGYYTTRLPFKGGQAIVLNSVFWSIVYTGGCLSRPHDPGRTELAWLDHTLSALPGNANAIVLMHIPPGYDAESTMIAHRFLAVPFLNGGAERQFLQTMQTHGGAIREIFGAHTHRYDFRIASGVPIFIASSVSPVYNNNPAFFDVTVDERGAIVDIVPYAYHLFDGSYQREPSFRSMYGIKAFNATTLRAIAQRIRTDDATRDIWKSAYDMWSWRVGDLDDDYVPFACAQTELGAGFAACAQTSKRTSAAEAAIALAIALVLAGVGWLLYVRRVKRRG
jgi:hypothetical protein